MDFATIQGGLGLAEAFKGAVNANGKIRCILNLQGELWLFEKQNEKTVHPKCSTTESPTASSQGSDQAIFVVVGVGVVVFKDGEFYNCE